ncbi:MAG: Uncharacterized protein AWT59_0342 [Candidatus Gallionella acididurans]|uniref:Uncharacterized protein n=1 Tax=Candidatus Gallionella acididurans TaxID=1796491 RepID=A0A139BWU0_9PROT|nr:MAG: Uncharacterized protein AWT59_0342 [Candidatus Gallionella acididurans]
MERKIYWGITLVALLILGVAFFQGDQPAEKSDLPWHIGHPTADTIQIFGVTLGQSNTNQAEQHFKEVAKPILFKSPNGQLAVEVFFEEVNLAGLKGRIVLSIMVPDSELQGMLARGLRMNATGGSKEITMDPDDVARVFTMPIGSLTYMPLVRLEDTVFAKRFGQPAQRIREKKSGVIHWLYPQNGLDIALGGSEKPLLQYVAPGDFDKLVKPLLTSGEIVQ